MACLHPITIYNNSKFISSLHAERYIQTVRCGQCADCMKTASNEWYYRAFFEFQDTIKNGNNGYVLFDTLTYRPKDLPHITDFIRIPKQYNFPCFNHEHFRLFFVRLRKYLERQGYNVADNLRYFLTSEYGSDDRYTHRPHYHLLLFVRDSSGLPFDVLSNMVAECWPYGRTDGIPYKGLSYVRNKRYFTEGLASSIFVCKYVSKYVMKTSSFQNEINKRLNLIMSYVANHRESRYIVTESRHNFDYDGNISYAIKIKPETSDSHSWLISEHGKKFRRDLNRQINQFHRQSKGFGLSALKYIDVDKVIADNMLLMPDNHKVVMRIPLPLYYKRKLFYYQYDYKGVKSWQPNELGMKYLVVRRAERLTYLANNLEAKKIQYHLDFDSKELAKYLLYKRGRLPGNLTNDLTPLERSKLPNLYYNYVTSTDKLQFGMKLITHDWLGYNKNYLSSSCVSSIPLSHFVQRNVYFNPEKEKLLDQLYTCTDQTGKKKQEVFDIKQRMLNLSKMLF